MEMYYCKKKCSYVISFDGCIIRSALQAIVDINGRRIGCEALSRIQIESTGEMIPPYIFFCDLKRKIGRMDVLFLINKLHLISYKSSKFFAADRLLFLNFTPEFFETVSKSPEIVCQASKIIKDVNLSKSNIVVEITEDHALSKDSMAKGCRLMAKSGFRIALDDYGDNSSGLERYEMCQPDIVKISRNVFLREKARGSYDALKVLIDKFKNDGCEVLIEGIECEDDYYALRKLEVDYFQGFLFHKPECVSSLSVVL